MAVDARPASPVLARLLTAFALFAACWAAVAPASAQTFPALSGRVVDEANLLPPDREAALTTRLAALEADTGDQLVVVTLNSLQGYEIEEYGYRLGRAWGIGQAETDSGVLLIVAPNERRVRIEVGYGLEPILTDAFSALVIQNQILPAFREGGFARGIEQGVDAVDAQLRLDPAEAQARAAAARPPRSEAPVGPAILVVIVFFFLFIGMIGGVSVRGRRRRSSGIAPIILWGVADALSRGGRGGGWGGGGGFGGGGFGGGGGGFGGGGASGGW
jgi:uncharacterized protein